MYPFPSAECYTFKADSSIKIFFFFASLLRSGPFWKEKNSHNKYVPSHHTTPPHPFSRGDIIIWNNSIFKMETFHSAISAMRKGWVFFGSVDLTEAFYSIPIRGDDRKYFQFWYEGQKYQFTSLIMGLTTSPKTFTKIMKPVFAILRKLVHVSTLYM